MYVYIFFHCYDRWLLMSLKNNVKWIALSQGIKIVLQLISLTVLTRLLVPKEYGLMAMATVVTNFSLIIRDLGTASAIIQRQELTQTICSTVFWLNVIMGIMILILIMLGTPIVAMFFNSPELIPLLLLLAFSFPIASFSSTHQALLERDSMFRIVAGIEIKSASIGLLIAIMMAYNGLGIYSLVGQTLSTCFLSTIQFWRVSTWRPSNIFSKKELKGLLGFSGNLTAFNFINYFSRNTDGVIIGHFFPAAILGAYSLAYRVMLFPLQSLTFVASRSLYPLMSRQQDKPEIIKAMYFKVIFVIASITAPMMAGLATLREPFVKLVFGEQWILVPSLLLWLAPTGFIQSIVSTTGSVFMAKGKTNLLMKLGAFSAFLFLSAFILGAQFDVVRIAQLYFLANIVNALFVLYCTIKIVDGKICEFFVLLLPPSVCASIMCVVIMLLQRQGYDQPNALMFIFQIFIGVVVYVLSYRLFFANRLVEIIPVWLGKYLLIRRKA